LSVRSGATKLYLTCYIMGGKGFIKQSTKEKLQLTQNCDSESVNVAFEQSMMGYV